MGNSFRGIGNASLEALRVFEAASRLGSFKAAAAELSVTPAAISQRIKALEESTGAMLFERLNRGLRLTPAGETLARSVRSALQQLDGAMLDLREQGRARGPWTITISAAPSFASKWLAPRLHRFNERHPGAEIRVLASDIVVDLTRDPGIDIALRYGSGPYPGVHCERLWEAHALIPVCAPALVANPGQPLDTPADLLCHQLLRVPLPSQARMGDKPGWFAWLTSAGIDQDQAQAAAERAPLFSNTHMALEAAAAGRGVALAPEVLVEEDLRTGRLVQPFPHRIPDPFSFWLLCRPDRTEERRIREFMRWMRSEASPL